MPRPVSRLLTLLAERQDITTAEAALALGVSKPAISRAATRLARRQLAVRQIDDLDGRLVRLRLTKAGMVQAIRCRAEQSKDTHP
jgi:DNA-binding MarR family transcriptional regulator